MICKYCGAKVSGKQCPSCGRVFPLYKRSTDLDILMSATPEREESGMPCVPLPAPGKGYEEGVREGFRKGLREGYENGYQEGSANIRVPPERFSVRKTVRLCAVSFLLAAVLSGVLCGFAEHRRGYWSAEEKYGSILATEREENRQSRSRVKELESEVEELKEKQEELERTNLELAEKNEDLEKKMKAQEDQADTRTDESQRDSQTEDGIDPGESDQAPESEKEEIPQFPYARKTHGGKYSAMVKKIQERLNELGIDVGKADGDYGKRTERGIEEFQRRNDLPVTGIVDEKTYERLFPDESEVQQENHSKKPSLSNESSGDPVDVHVVFAPVLSFRYPPDAGRKLFR